MEALTVPQSPTPRTVPARAMKKMLEKKTVLHKKKKKKVPARAPHPAATAGVAAPADTTIKATPE